MSVVTSSSMPSSSLSLSSPSRSNSSNPQLSYQTCPIYASSQSIHDPTPIRHLAFTVRGVPLSTHIQQRSVVIFLPGGGMGRDTTGFDTLEAQQKWLEDHSITLITVDRAGYGASRWPDYQHLTSRMKIDASDLFTLVRFLSLSRCYFLGHSGGCPGLLTYAANPEYSPTIIRMALTCSPTPLCGTVNPPELTFKRKVQKFLMVHSWSREWLIIPAMRSLVKGWILKPAEMLKFSEREMSAPKDKEWWQQNRDTKRTTMLRSVTSAMQHTDTDFEIKSAGGTNHKEKELQASFVSNMLDILLSDLVESIQVFPDLSSISSSIDVWYGDLDEPAPHGQWLAEHIPGSRPMKCEGHGHQLVFSLFPNILTRLVEPSAPAAHS